MRWRAPPPARAGRYRFARWVGNQYSLGDAMEFMSDEEASEAAHAAMARVGALSAGDHLHLLREDMTLVCTVHGTAVTAEFIPLAAAA